MSITTTPYIESQDLKELQKFLKAAIEKKEVDYEGRQCFAEIDTTLSLTDIDNIESHFVGKSRKTDFSSHVVSKGFFGQRDYYYDLLTEHYFVSISLKNANDSIQFNLTIKNTAQKVMQSVASVDELDEETLQKIAYRSEGCTIV